MAPSLGGNSGPQLGDTAAVSRHAFRRGFSGRAEGMPSLVTGQTYNSPAELMAAKEEIPDFDVMNTPWAPKLSDDPHVAMQQGQREYLREYGYRTGQSQRPADQQKWVDSWIANKGQMPAQRGGFPDGGPPQTPADALPTTAGPAGAQPAPNTGSILPDNFAGTVGANQPMPVAQPAPAQTAETAGQAGAQMDQQRLNQTIDQEKATNPTGGPTQPELDQAQLSERLNDQNRPVPERQQDARAYVQSLVDSDPELKQGLNDLAGGKDTPNARAFQSRIDGAGNNFVSQEFQRMMAERQAQTGAPPTTQEQGGFFQQAMDGWNNMSMPMKMMMGLGLGAGVVGLMSSLFGEGGGGMGLLGLLGLGVAGVGGAMGGMFGEGAQSGVNNMLLDAGQAMGMVPGKQDLSTLMADNPVAAAANQGGGGGLMGAVMGGTAGAKAQLAKAEQQRGQLQQLAGLPASLRNSLLMRMDPNNIKSPADAERAFANSQQILGAFDDPNSDIGKQLAAGRAYTDGGKTWYGRAGQAVDAIGQAGSAMGAFASDPMGYANQAGQATRAAISDWWTGGQEKQNSFHQHEHIVRYLVAQWADETTTKRAFNAMDAKELHDLQTLQAQKPTYDLKNTRRLHELQKRKMSQPPSNQREKIIVLCQKAARCWAGYEPVPGKAPYSNDSCRPAGSKKKPETKKKSAK
jgi:hypothetical protein